MEAHEETKPLSPAPVRANAHSHSHSQVSVVSSTSTSRKTSTSSHDEGNWETLLQSDETAATPRPAADPLEACTKQELISKNKRLTEVLKKLKEKYQELVKKAGNDSTAGNHDVSALSTTAADMSTMSTSVIDHSTIGGGSSEELQQLKTENLKLKKLLAKYKQTQTAQEQEIQQLKAAKHDNVPDDPKLSDLAREKGEPEARFKKIETELTQRVQSLEGEVRSLQAQLQTAAQTSSSTIATLSKDLEEAQSSRCSLLKDINGIKEKCAALETENMALRDGKASAESMLATAQVQDSDSRRLHELQEDLSAALQRAADAESSAESQRTLSNAEASRLQEDLNATKLQLEDALGKLKHRESELAELESQQRLGQDEVLARQSEERRALQTQLESAEKTVRETSARLEATLAQYESERQRAGELERKVEALVKEAETKRRENEEIVERSKEALTRSASEIVGLKARVQQLDVAKARVEAQLEEERASLAQVQKQLAEASMGASQSNMLDLELADYQRTVESLNQQVTDLQGQVSQLRERNADQEKTIESLRQEIDFGTQRKAKADSNFSKLKAIYAKMKQDFEQKCEELDGRIAERDESRLKADAISRELEEAKARIASLTVTLDNIDATHREGAMLREVEMRQLKFDLESALRELAQTKAELQDTSTAFKAYKVRAHSVLKAEREKGESQVSSEETLKQLRGEVESLTSRLRDSEAKAADAQASLVDLETDFEELMKKHELLAKEFETSKLRHEEQLAKAMFASEQVEQEQMAVIHQLRAEAEVKAKHHAEEVKKVSKAYEERVEELQESVRELRAQVAAAKAQTEHLKQHGALGSASAAGAAPHSTAGLASSSSAFSKHDSSDSAGLSGGNSVGNGGGASASLSSRHGSNSSLSALASQSSASSSQPQHSLLDLGALLAGGGAKETAPPPAQQEPIDMDKLVKEHALAKSQVEHLSNLIRESEANVDRLTEQSKILKEEIRRLERNTVREQSTNLEYLKNVLIKFLTNEDGREHLIPVFGMLLHFSPEEMERVKTAFADHLAAQESSKASGSWSSIAGSYFARWN